MTRIAPVRMPYNPRILWFDAGDHELEKDQAVVVLTARGVELGYVNDPVFEATDEQVAALKTPLKPVKRIATEQDIDTAREMERLSAEALPVFKEMAAEVNAEMRPVSVEYLLEGDKAVFYFEAEDRVDFRELVRQLAAHFHVRIDMRQIGVRDEARMVGGLGHCGQELCCKRLGGEFCPVSIRMAKEQDLSLNPQKISGVCGRLMCCLRYEYDAYKDFKSRAPKQGSMVQTPEGPCKVQSLDVPREVVHLRTEEGKTVKIPLADMEPAAEEGGRPDTVGEEAWTAATDVNSMHMARSEHFLTSKFTQEDKLGEAGAIHHVPGGSGASSRRRDDDQPASGSKSGRSRRSRRQKEEAAAPTTGIARKARRRSTTVNTAEGTVETTVAADLPAKEASKAEDQAQAEKKRTGGMRPRRRRRGSGDKDQQNRSGSQNQQKQEAKDAGKGSAHTVQNSSGAEEKKDRPRPGQKSSGVRNAPEGSEQSAGTGSPNRRRRRRRSNKPQNTGE